MPDMDTDDIEFTDKEWREMLAILFSGSKRTPEETTQAKDRLRAAFQLRPSLAPPQFGRQIQTPGEIKKSG